MPLHQRRRRLRGISLASMLLLVLAPARPALAVMIDDFSVGPITVTRTGASAATALQTGLDPNHVLGGARAIEVGDAGVIGQSLTIDPTLQQLRFTTPAGGGRGYFEIDYGSEALPLNADLTADGSDAFLIEFAGPGGHVSLNWVRLQTANGESVLGGGNSGTIQSTLPDGRVLMEYPFSAFGGLPDFTAVQRIQLEFFRLSPGSEAVLLGFTTIPEPTAAVLFAFAAIAATHRRRATVSS